MVDFIFIFDPIFDPRKVRSRIVVPIWSETEDAEKQSQNCNFLCFLPWYIDHLRASGLVMKLRPDQKIFKGGEIDTLYKLH